MEPSFQCQLCRSKLNLVGQFEPILENKPLSMQARHSTLLHGSMFDASRIDESFMILQSDRRPQGGGMHKGLEESFVVVKSPTDDTASMPWVQQHPRKQQASSSEGADGFGAKMQSQTTLFELASTATNVDHPLCVDCVNLLKQEVNTQVQETERDIAAYSAAVAKLEAKNLQPVPQEEFECTMRAAAAEEAASLAEAEEVERQLAAVGERLAVLQAESRQLDELEERYWQDLNDYHLQLSEHVEERDALLSRIDRASQRLQMLKGTNVYNDAFRIWHDGPFGTISGFRLGRTSECPVEWDEINAAWGQAVLLLHTMAQACKLNFSSYKLLPMGSHPRIADHMHTYDLFGPVNMLNKMFITSDYDRAMICYLACLKELGEFAAARDRQENKQPVFQFPFTIQGDKIQGHTIKMTRDKMWTRALKYMLANLKFALQWMIKRHAEELPILPQLGPEGPSTVPV